MRKIFTTALAATLALSMLAGCGANNTSSSSSAAETTKAADETSKTADAKDIQVVFIPKLTGNSFFESANVGAQDIAKKVGFDCKYDGNPEASVANQVQVINSAVQQGANAIAISST